MLVLPPEHADELLPWYCCWSNELATKMHQRHLVWNEQRYTVCLSFSHDCTCDSEWHCEPHNTCFIYDLCFCPSSSSFLPVKPPRTSLLSPLSYSVSWCFLTSKLSEFHSSFSFLRSYPKLMK